MIKRIVSVRPKFTKLLEARQWSQEMDEYMKKKYPQSTSEVYIERFGNTNTHHFISQFKDLAELEKVMAESQADQEFIDLYTKGADLFTDGSQRAILMEPL